MTLAEFHFTVVCRLCTSNWCCW